MQPDISRRSFLRTCNVAGAAIAIGEGSVGQATSPIASAPVGSIALCAGLNSHWSRTIRADSTSSSGSITSEERAARSLPQCRRMRRVLPHRGAFPPP